MLGLKLWGLGFRDEYPGPKKVNLLNYSRTL